MERTKTKRERVLARPPREFCWIEEPDSVEELCEIFAKLRSISDYFSTFQGRRTDDPVDAATVYGYWFILRDICNGIERILKVDYWTGETGKKADEGE